MGERCRARIQVTGVVQGVGFRPFVYGLATRMGLAGSVCNGTGSVEIDVEGDRARLESFAEALAREAPPLARVQRIRSEPAKPRGVRGFRIESSARSEADAILVSPDVGTCEECLREITDPGDRRFGYPFTNCTNCGPRFTITEELPYDRQRTTMKGFVLCDDCHSEYENPRDRRFHAQPTACPICGPKLRGWRDGAELEGDALIAVVRALRQGEIVALKGLGGYHLACDAARPAVVSELRRRKRRDAKPLAIMVPEIEDAERLCAVSPEERTLLLSRERPIVLLDRRPGASVAPEVGQGSPKLGVMLPYTPLHHLLMQAMKAPLVMTSGNESDQPIVYRDEDARTRLAGIADLLISHDRPIHLRCEDSVVQVAFDKSPAWIRRSRGYVPGAIPLPPKLAPLEAPILALGAELKNTFAFGMADHAILSHHVGDLDELSAYEAYRTEIDKFERLFRAEPRILAHDLHPDFLSTRYALERAREPGLKTIAVQHHHAHLASCMAEHGLAGPVIGVIFDGTGYGTDGRIWGGEFLVGDYTSFERAAHLKEVPMPGGEQAVREPWRMAVSQLLAGGLDPSELGAAVPETAIATVRKIVERGRRSAPGAPLTSSMGRLFDAVSSLLGVRHQASFEGQAAMELEWLAMRAGPTDASYPFELLAGSEGSPLRIDPSPVIASVVWDLRRGVEPRTIARRFHASVAQMIARVCEGIRASGGPARVVLSGGVFMNLILLREASARLVERGFQVFRHRQVPPNDGGISLGQLAIAAASCQSSILDQEDRDVSRDSRPNR